MSEQTYFRPTVVRTNRGLTIAGTRKTLYQIMDYVKAGESPETIRDHFRLTIKQTSDVLDYIRTHYDEVDAEYRRIMKKTEEIRKYWSERNRKRFAEIAALPRKPEHKEIWAKIDERKSQRPAENDHHDSDRP